MPLFVDYLSAAKKHSQSCRCTSVTFTTSDVAQERSLSLRFLQVMLDENVDLVAGDFNDNRNNISTIEEAFADCALPMPPGPTPLWGPGSIPGNWADVCGFLKPPESDRHWKVRFYGAFSFRMMSWACARPTRVAITKSGSTSTLLNGATNSHTVRNTIEGST